MNHALKILNESLDDIDHTLAIVSKTIPEEDLMEIESRRRELKSAIRLVEETEKIRNNFNRTLCVHEKKLINKWIHQGKTITQLSNKLRISEMLIKKYLKTELKV